MPFSVTELTGCVCDATLRVEYLALGEATTSLTFLAEPIGPFQPSATIRLESSSSRAGLLTVRGSRAPLGSRATGYKRVEERDDVAAVS